MNILLVFGNFQRYFIPRQTLNMKNTIFDERERIYHSMRIKDKLSSVLYKIRNPDYRSEERRVGKECRL